MKTIMISLDTLRASRLGCYGYAKPTSPYMDEIASQGVLFEKAYAADIPTEVAHTGIFTGKVGLTTGVVSHGSELSGLPKSVEWLPALLRSAGFTTAAVDNLYQLKEWFARGYRYYINSVGGRRWIDGRTINDLAKPWIKEHKDENFFLFLHYWDPHTPYLPPERYVPMFYDARRNRFDPSNRSMDAAYNHMAYPFFKRHHYELLGPVTDAEYINALYDAEIRYLDDLLRELDAFLEAQGIRDETLLILFGDHGESLTEHDIFWDHCGLYETTVHIPVIMRWPGVIPAGRRVKGLIQQADLMPTVLEAARLATPSVVDASRLDVPAGLDGRSLWPAIRGEAESTRSAVYLSECAWQAARGIRTGRYKFIRTLDAGPFSRPPRELYDLHCRSGGIGQPGGFARRCGGRPGAAAGRMGRVEAAGPSGSDAAAAAGSGAAFPQPDRENFGRGRIDMGGVASRPAAQKVRRASFAYRSRTHLMTVPSAAWPNRSDKPGSAPKTCEQNRNQVETKGSNR